MPDLTPKRHDPTPAAKTPTAKKPAEVIPVKSSAVISKSYRVRELPPPPVVAPVAEVPQASELLKEARLPDSLGGSAQKEPEAPIELDALNIRPSRAWTSVRRRIRLPSRWEQWLTNPARRNSVGVGASVALNVAILVLLAFVFKAPARPSPPPRLPARYFTVAADSRAPSTPGQRAEPVVQQLGAGALESVAADSQEEGGDDGSDCKLQIANCKSQIPDLRSQISHLKSQISDTSPRASGANSPTATPAGTADAAPGITAGSRASPDLLQAADAAVQGKLKRRTLDGRSEGVRYGGGSSQSEEAVERALRWLVAHQRADGSWSFNHVNDGCEHYCTSPGTEPSTTGATGLALLPFLGAGYTHKQGDYREVVQRGLDYLKRRGMRISYGNDLRDGSSMYGHALATIALCEAYGLTRDEQLKEAAQGALDYIAYAQDFKSGGWRYNPGEPGDTTVTGWMLMALKSGQMAKLNIQSPEIFGAQRFLDSVQNKDGSQYGYLTRKPGQATTAVGLLCRMYTGWRRTNPGLVKGAAQLGKWGPSRDNIYFDYYATQVLFHYAGPEWDGWNRKMRDLLIQSQAREGHPAGSWFFENPPTSTAGGRLYSTAMAAMILEVYYRFMPLYGEEAVKE